MVKEVPFKAGFGRRDITPRKPCFLVGYPHVERTSTGIHDPLFASVLCLESCGVTLVLVSLDILFVTADWTCQCREKIFDATGIPAEHILIAATHTHSGPHTAEVLAWKDDPVVPAPDPEFLDFLLRETTSAAVSAWSNRVPAELAATSADVRGLAGGNRIDSQGAEDPEAGLVLVRRSGGGGPIAILASYGMHPTVLHQDSTLFSADFIHFTRAHLERAYPGAGVVYLNGVCGDQSPRRFVHSQTFEEAERIGLALGRRMEDALGRMGGFQSAVTLGAAIDEIDLEGKKFPPVCEAETALENARRVYRALRSSGAEHSRVRTAECTVFGAEEVLTLARAEVSGDTRLLREKCRRAEIQAFRIGNIFVLGWPGEFFVEYGLGVKKRAPGKILFSTMTNGELQGYIVTPEAEAAGGYEAQMSLFSAETGRRFVDSSLRLLERLNPKEIE